MARTMTDLMAEFKDAGMVATELKDNSVVWSNRHGVALARIALLTEDGDSPQFELEMRHLADNAWYSQQLNTPEDVAQAMVSHIVHGDAPADEPYLVAA